MANRNGEKWGWLGGWIGSFLWMLIFAIVWLVQRKFLSGLVFLGIYLLSVLLIFALSPWRNPGKRYWMLMLPLFVIFIISAILMIIVFGGIKALGMNWWILWIIIPISNPFFTIGRRRWSDGEKS